MSCAGCCGPSRARGGFTAVELVIVMIIAGIILSVAIPAFGRMAAQRGAANARDSIVLLSARARALAMERGSIVHLEVDPVSQRSWVRIGSDTVQVVTYSQEFHAQLSTPDGQLVGVCYASRGLALPSCSSAALPVTVDFRRGGFTYSARIQRLGRVERAI